MSKKPLKHSTISRIVALVTAVCLLTPATADLIQLKDGRKILGKAKKVGDKLVIEGAYGSTEVPLEEVVDWQTKSPAEKDYETRLAKIDEKDADGFYRLGTWAKRQGMSTQAKSCFLRAVAIKTDHIGARTSLGFVDYKGEWVKAEVKYRAQGLIRFKGQWMTPQQKAERARDLERLDEMEKKLQLTRHNLRRAKQKQRFIESENRSLERKNKKLRSTNKALTNTNRTLSQQNRELASTVRSVRRENREYCRQVTDLRTQVSHLEDENRCLRHENRRLRNH